MAKVTHLAGRQRTLIHSAARRAADSLRRALKTSTVIIIDGSVLGVAVGEIAPRRAAFSFQLPRG
jgi:nucleoside-triphosphatase THEP1